MVLKKYLNILPWRASYEDGEEEVMRDKINKVLHFDFEFDSHLTLTAPVGVVDEEVTAHVPFYAVDYNKIGQIKATAPMQWPLRQHFEPGQGCSVVYNPPEPGVVSVMSVSMYRTKVDKKWTISDVRVIAYPDRANDGFEIVCPDAPAVSPFYWWPEFGVLHEDELTTYPEKPVAPPTIAFAFDAGWATRKNGDPIIGIRKYDQTMDFNGATVKEATKLKLVHTPQ